MDDDLTFYGMMSKHGVPKSFIPSIPDTTKYMIFSWPFHTLAINRILNTVISRKKSSQCGMLLDWRDMMRIGGLKAVFAGYFTTLLF